MREKKSKNWKEDYYLEHDPNKGPELEYVAWNSNTKLKEIET